MTAVFIYFIYPFLDGGGDRVFRQSNWRPSYSAANGAAINSSSKVGKKKQRMCLFARSRMGVCCLRVCVCVFAGVIKRRRETLMESDTSFFSCFRVNM